MSVQNINVIMPALQEAKLKISLFRNVVLEMSV
jgi:hypothetical protein